MPAITPARLVHDPPKNLPRWTSQAPARISTLRLIGTTLASITVLVCLVLLGELSGHLLLIPPMAASMALVAAAPQMPLSQPRSVVGGHIVSALIGIGAGLISHSIWAAAIAGGLAIGMTLWLRMPHSPAAATAVIGTTITEGQVSFVICCAIAAGILVIFGVVGWHLRGTSYPTYWI